MTRPIGYYVHHHGDGHRQRALAIGNEMDGGLTLLGTGLAGRSGALCHVDLPDDRIDARFAGADEAKHPPSLHYAPTDHEGVRLRTARIANWIAEERPTLMMVDVSVEVAMLARLSSVPTVYVRLNGKRHDRPHIDAFDAATALLAPFHEALDDPATPCWVRAKTFYAPNLVRAEPRAALVERNMVLVVAGRGGPAFDGEDWVAAARATPDLRWRVIGPCSAPVEPPANLELRGWEENADAMIAAAGVVVGAAGDGVVGAVLAHRRPFICLPEERPFDEQYSKAGRLSALGVAVVPQRKPCGQDWPRLIADAVDRALNWPSQLADPGGPVRVARWLATLATATNPIDGSRVE